MPCPQCQEDHNLSQCPRWKMKSLLLLPLVLLTGCAGFKLGTMVYIPAGQMGTVEVKPPEKAASGVK